MNSLGETIQILHQQQKNIGRNFISKNDAKTRRPGAAHCCQVCVSTNKQSFQTSALRFRHTN